MCFQGYVHWLCKHTSLYEDCCASALSLDLPFHLKISCPSYTINTRSPQRYCGVGHFYCAQTPEGIKLDHMHLALSTAVEESSKIEERLYAEGGLREVGQEIGNEILRRGGGNEECERDEKIREVFEEVGRLKMELEGIKLRERELKGMIERAKVYFEQKAAYYGGDGRMAPGMYLPSLQGGVVQRPTRLAGLNSERERRRDFSGGQYQMGRLQQRSTYGQYQTGPHHLGLNQVDIHGRQHISPDVPQTRPSLKRRQKESSPEKPSPPVRRSSRVRTKKTTYAESESDTFSRTPSPEKSDAADSNFSLSKQASLNQKSQSNTSSSLSLVDKISDWQKRDSNKTLHEPLPQAPLQSISNISSSIPQSENVEWKLNLNVYLPPQNPIKQASQAWKLNRYDGDLTLPPPTHRVAGTVQQKSMDYSSLRQGFSATANLSPYIPPQHIKTTNSEPQKGRLSGPLPPQMSIVSSKRMKLSFSGDDGFPVLEGGALAMHPMATKKTLVSGNMQEELDDEVPMKEEIPILEEHEGIDDDVDVHGKREEESELSDIDWDVLEEGILED